MNHGIAQAIELLLKDKEEHSAKEIIEVVSRYHRRFCGCLMRYTLDANIRSMLSQEMKRKNPRWHRIKVGIYQAR